MKQIIALRHAKAEAGSPKGNDFERDLQPVGEEACALIGQWLKKHAKAPDLVLASPSQRSSSTWLLVADEAGWKPKVEWPDRLYLASTGDIFAMLQKLPADVARVMLVGHNPGIHQFAVSLSGAGDADLLEDLSLSFPTAALVVMEADIDTWSALSPGGGTLKSYTTPKQLR